MGGWTDARATEGDGYGTQFKVPTVGAYAVLSAPYLLMGVQAYHDELSIRPAGLVSAGPIDGRKDTLAASLSAPVVWGNYTVEPYADYRASSVHINTFTVLGNTGTLGFLPQSGDTAGGGLRLSAALVSNGIHLKPFVSLGVESVSGHGEQSVFTPAGGAAPVTLTTTGPGSYTTASAGLDAQFQSGLQAYARIDDRSGSAINGLSLSGGVRLRF